MDYFDYDSFKRTTTNNKPVLNFSKILSNLTITIVSQKMDGAVNKWLNYLKLQKYQWFFNSLSYFEIQYIDSDNIEGFMMKVNRNFITKGAQKKICLFTKVLRDRSKKLTMLLVVIILINLIENTKLKITFL